MRFTLPTDPTENNTVEITANDGSKRRVFRSIALRLFLERPRKPPPATGVTPIVALSFAVPPDAGPHPVAYVCVDSSVDDDVDDKAFARRVARQWPDPSWAGAPPPVHTVPFAPEWVPLPPSADATAADDIVQRCLAARRLRETTVTQQMEERCQNIVEHGDDEHFTESLDFCPRPVTDLPPPGKKKNPPPRTGRVHTPRSASRPPSFT